MTWCVRILVLHSSIALYDRAAGVVPSTTTASIWTTTSRQQSCKDMACPPMWVPNAANKDIECRSVYCSQVDRNVCCLPTCIEMQCPPGWFQNPSNKHEACQSSNGCSEVDKNVCCQHTCQDFDCGVNFTNKATNQVCSAGSPCTREQCCAATCGHYSCPQHYVSRGASLPCHDSVNCRDAEDRDICCQPTCAGVTCGPRRIRKPPQTPCQANGQCSIAECCRETCDGYPCQQSFILKSNATDIVCSESQFHCARSDNAKCCDRVCLSFTCDTYFRKKTLQDIRCNDPTSCTLSECCKATCAGYQGCVGTWQPRLNSATIDCSNPAGCTDADREVCCQRTCGDYTCPVNFWKQDAVVCTDAQGCKKEECCRSTCQGYTCPSNWKNKENGMTLPCANAAECTDADRDTCCELTCQSFSCPAFHTAKSAAITIPCTDPAGCTKVECCHANCEGITCPLAWEKRANASDIACSTPAKCTQDDLPKCCYPTCESVAWSPAFTSRGRQQCQLAATNVCTAQECCEATCSGLVCPDSFISRPGTNLTKCEDPLRCNVGQDRDTCCRRTCASHQCPVSFKKDADVVCRENNMCTDSECCRATCLSFQCPEAWTRKLNPGSTLCADPSGCTLADRNTCCHLTCESYVCPATYIPKDGASLQRICQDPTGCTRSECCQATCSNYTCPSLPHMWSTVANPSSVMCKDPYACSVADRQACCKLTCNTFDCPQGFWKYKADVECNDKDGGCITSECCHATCNGYDCGTNWKLKQSADSIMCKNGLGCVADDRTNCCQLTCGSYSCDAQHSANDASIECADNAGCTRNECCRANCAGYNCTATWEKKANPSTIMCSDISGCTFADRSTCCRPTCETIACPLHYASAGRRICTQSYECSQSECCLPTCSNYACPSSWRLQPNADQIKCSSTPGCLVETCCQPLCSNFTCPSTHRLRPDASGVVCPHSLGASGCSARDLSSCCEAPCTSFFCTGKWRKRDNAADLFCPGPSGCTSNDFARCCLVPITCANYTCPPPMLKKPLAQNILCHDMERCTDIDISTCCDPFAPTTLPSATCLSYTCPFPWTHKANTDAVACKLSTGCTDDDLRTCCEEPGSPCGTVAPKPHVTEPLGEKVGKLLANGVAAVNAVHELLAPRTTTERPLVINGKVLHSASPTAGAETTSTPAKTSLSVAHKKGTSKLEVASTAGFEVGQDVMIDPETSIAEANQIVGFASLLLKSPLVYDHDAGAVVTRITTLAKIKAREADAGGSSEDSGSDGSSDVFDSSSGQPAWIYCLIAVGAVCLALLVAGLIAGCCKNEVFTGQHKRNSRQPEFTGASREDSVFHWLIPNRNSGNDQPMNSMIPPEPSHEFKIGLPGVGENSQKSGDNRYHHVQPLEATEATPMSSASPIPVIGLTPPAGLSYVNLQQVGTLEPTTLDLSRSGMNYIDPAVGSPFHSPLDVTHPSMNYSPLDVTHPSMNYASASGYGFNGDGISQSPGQVHLDFGTMALAPELFPETGNLIAPPSTMQGFPGQDYSGMDYGQPSYSNSRGFFPNSGYVGVPGDVPYN